MLDGVFVTNFVSELYISSTQKKTNKTNETEMGAEKEKVYLPNSNRNRHEDQLMLQYIETYPC